MKTGLLRKKLLDDAEAVRTGALAVDKAHANARLMAQVNTSVYAEAKIARLKMESGEKWSSKDFGHLDLGENPESDSAPEAT